MSDVTLTPETPETAVRQLLEAYDRKIGELTATLDNNSELFQERLAELEMWNEDRDYLRMTMDADREFSREGLRRICRIARMMWLKNPLVQRMVNVKRLYVWGQGVSVKASDPDIDTVVQSFMDDYKNRQEFTSHEARMMKETDLECDGNIFFVLFANPSDGRVRLRSIPVDEVGDILTNPQDSKSAWFYKRQWNDRAFDMTTGVVSPRTHIEYYPDWRYDPVNKPEKMGGYPINWDKPVYHVKIGAFSDWRYGVPEVYAAIDWARAYKSFLENWSSITAAYARFAWQVKTPGGAPGIAAAKAKINTTVAAGQNNTYPETNPPANTASTFITQTGPNGAELTPIKTAGATTSAADGRHLLLMVAAVAGLPETFFGDASSGSLATARSLDRPTELMMQDRRTLWMDVIDQLIDYAVLKSIEAPSGKLAGKGHQVIEEVVDGIIEKIVIWGRTTDQKTGAVVDTNDHIDIEFPPLVQLDMDKLVKSIVDAATLGNAQGTLAGTLDLITLRRMLLVALGQDDVDEVMDQIALAFPDGVPETPATPATPDVPQAESQMIEAVRELRETIRKILEAK